MTRGSSKRSTRPRCRASSRSSAAYRSRWRSISLRRPAAEAGPSSGASRGDLVIAISARPRRDLLATMVFVARDRATGLVHGTYTHSYFEGTDSEDHTAALD